MEEKNFAHKNCVVFLVYSWLSFGGNRLNCWKYLKSCKLVASGAIPESGLLIDSGQQHKFYNELLLGSIHKVAPDI